MIGGYGRGWRHRRLFYATGMPGYGRGRCYWVPPPPVLPGAVYSEERPGRTVPYGLSTLGMSEKDELKMLEEEEQFLRQELEELTAAIKQLKEKTEKGLKK